MPPWAAFAMAGRGAAHKSELECLRAHHKPNDWPRWTLHGAAAATGTIFQNLNEFI